MNKQNQLQNKLPTPKLFLPSFALGGGEYSVQVLAPA